MKIYCEICKKAREFKLFASEDKIFPKQKIWGDLLCKECHFVIATVSDFKEEGLYEFKKIKDILKL